MPIQSKIADWAKQLIFPMPRSCLICGENHHLKKQFVCQKCYSIIKRVYPPLCNNCGRPLLGANFCLHCRNKEFFFDRVFSFGLYEGNLQALIHLFKFRKYSGLGYEIIKLMINEMDFVNAINECILVPVPLHPKKILTRGYNQAQVLCEALAVHTNLQWSDILIRKHHARPQSTYKLSKRKQAVREQFAVRRKWLARLGKKKILLVDDVITTGSTLNECAKALKDCGVEDVIVLTIATTLLK